MGSFKRNQRETRIPGSGAPNLFHESLVVRSSTKKPTLRRKSGGGGGGKFPIFFPCKHHAQKQPHLRKMDPNGSKGRHFPEVPNHRRAPPPPRFRPFGSVRLAPGARCCACSVDWPRPKAPGFGGCHCCYRGAKREMTSMT